jgi:hypothetical protein
MTTSQDARQTRLRKLREARFFPDFTDPEEVAAWAGGPANYDKTYYCNRCPETFRRPVWHCRWCGSHWILAQRQCKNCYRYKPGRPGGTATA